MPAPGQRKILNSAFKLFSERGFDGVSIRDIAADAGLTNPALYRHYPSKEALGLALYRKSYDAVLERIEGKVRASMSGLEKLEAYIEACVDLHRIKPSPLLFLDQLQDTFWPKVREEYGERTLAIRLLAWVREGQKAGEIRTDVDAIMLTTVPSGLVSEWSALARAGLAPWSTAAATLKQLTRDALMA
jgi:AcrR family transcriptional regulator